MAERIELKIEDREVTGKNVKFLRNKGVVPVHLFGHNLPSKALQGDSATVVKAIAFAGHTRLINLKVGSDPQNHVVMVKEVQKNPIKGNLLHVDFYEVNMAEKIKVEVPIALVGEAPALKIRENMLYQTLNSLHIECLPENMPDKIQVDISGIVEVDQAIHVRDVVLAGVTILNDSDVQIVKVSLRPVEVVEEKPVAAAAAVEGAAPAEGAAAAAPAEGAKGAAAPAKGAAAPAKAAAPKAEAKK
jgi:large subunit ribosomal protein L25